MNEMRLLEILSAFAEEGTQTAAAEKLHISQPTLSSSMRKLEEEIGAPLFERTKNRMVLNENGQAAAEYAEQICGKKWPCRRISRNRSAGSIRLPLRFAPIVRSQR